MTSASGAGGGGASATVGGGGQATGGSASGGSGASAGGSAGSTTGGAGAGGASGGSSGAGGSAGAESGPVKPTQQNNRWAFVVGDVTLEVDPQVGGRITTFSKGTENLLTGPNVNPTYWGSTLWTSPETQWQQPPPGPIDSEPYAVQASDTALVLTGMPYAMLGVSVTKTLSAERGNGGSFKIEYKLTNTKQTPIMMAPWEVTRVLPRGLTFFPTGTKTSFSPGATMPTTTSDGITWYAYDMAAVTIDSKLYADAAEGWLAHVAQGLVFIKSFGDVPVAQIAPNEGDVELYTNALHTYIELENQAAYGAIAPGASTSWSVTWYLRALPAGITAAPSAALAQFVRTTINP